MTGIVLSEKQSKALLEFGAIIAMRLFCTYFGIALILLLVALAIGILTIGQEQTFHFLFHEPKGIGITLLVHVIFLIVIPALFLQRFVLKPSKYFQIIQNPEKQKFNQYVWRWFFIALAINILCVLLHFWNVGLIAAYYIATRLVIMRLVKSGDVVLKISNEYLP